MSDLMICRFTYYPRKGTITHLGVKIASSSTIATYPRKGTITHRNRTLSALRTGLQLIPARGQKTPHLFLMRSFSFANLSSLFSVGCLSMNGMIAAAVIFFLLQLLHSDKICYNKANSEHLSQNRQIHFPFIVQFFHNP